jgi:hypothetical protein
MCEWRVQTNAPRIAVDVFNSNGRTSTVGIRVNGRAYTQSASVVSTFNFYQFEFPLPAPTNLSDPTASTQEVSVHVGENSVFEVGVAWKGMPYARALYVPASASLQCLRPQSTRRLEMYGDSTTMGLLTPIPWLHCYPGQMRRRFPGETCVEGGAGRQFFNDAATGAQQLAFANTIGRFNPTDFAMLIGYNDYNVHPWAAAAFGTAYSAFLTALVARLPNTKIWCITPIPSTVETDQGGGTLGAYRSQIVSAAGGFPNNATAVLGPNLVTTALLQGDGVHMTQEGCAEFTRNLCTTMNLA